ncbi:MAG: hypothetical protein ABL874_07020 [Sphingopyxis sp.]
MAMDTTAHLAAAALSQPSAERDEQAIKTSLRAKKAKRLARHVIVRALIECDGKIERAAKKTGLTPAIFSEQMRQYQLPRPIMYRPGIGVLSTD